MARFSLWVFLVFLLVPGAAEAVQANVDRYEIREGTIYADVSLVDLPPQFTESLRNGMEKRLEYRVELFRVWELWMDEFIGGVELFRTVKYDLLKDEYRLHSEEPGNAGHLLLKDEALTVKYLTAIEGIPVLPVSEAERGTFYIRVQVRSRLRELPPVVGGLLFFVPEIEFYAEGRSPRFPLHK